MTEPSRPEVESLRGDGRRRFVPGHSSIDALIRTPAGFPMTRSPKFGWPIFPCSARTTRLEALHVRRCDNPGAMQRIFRIRATGFHRGKRTDDVANGPEVCRGDF